MDKRIKNNEKIAFGFFCVMLLLLFLTVLIVIPFNGGPDEAMRYQISQYIYNYMELPRGDTPEILNPVWGISYAFTPINSYIISAFVMKIVSFFGVGAENLFYAARIVSVLFSMGTAIFCFKIGQKLFKGIYLWLFMILATLLPEFIFISGYVNCDAIAIFSVAWIIYALLCGKESKWSTKNCLFLGASLGCCALSYYNAYGMILFAAAYCVVDVMLDKTIENKLQFLLVKIGWTALAAIIVAGWWFVRNAILYDGDFLGLTASKECAELNAADAYKPSNRTTPAKLGYSIKYVLYDMKWIETSMRSFVAAFGSMQYFVEESLCNWYYYIIGFGIVAKAIEYVHNLIDKIKAKRAEMVYNKEEHIDNGFFWICMFATCVTTIGISLYYSCFNDYQPQGRYCIPMLVPMALLVTSGFQYIGKRINVYVGKILSYCASMYLVFLAIYAIFFVLVTHY